MKNRISKNRRALQRMKVRPVVVIDRGEMDKQIFDLVLKMLYENADRNALHIENDIFAPSNVALPIKESERLWEVMLSSGWVSPVVGFGNAGKIELTKAGYQLMSQFGGYSQYLAAVKDNNQPQTIILPIQVQEDDSLAEVPQLLPPGNNKAAQKSLRKSRHGKK